MSLYIYSVLSIYMYPPSLISEKDCIPMGYRKFDMIQIFYDSCKIH